ncbi:MAG: nuclease A inhibitor family protein [Cytophagaceae bacterium]|nr:nuclease A inhibitor family protein [Cytophagaceae bacterium]
MSETKEIKSNNFSLKETVEPLLVDLYYPSESDEPIEFVELNLPPEAEPLNERSAGEFLAQKSRRQVDELEVEEFFAPVVDVEEWFTDEERQAAERFTQVREILQQHLKDFKVFKIGYNERDLYLLGLTPEGQRVGLKTKVTETD